MDLSSFLADDSLGGGSWADEEVDMNSIGIQSSTAAVPEQPINTNNSFDSAPSNNYQEERRERKEFPVPDQPPYRARVANLPWDIVEDDVADFFHKRMQLDNIISDVKLPSENGRLKGFGFVTFTERKFLEEALLLNTSDFNGRRIFVNVAAPQRQDVFDVDWRAARTGPLGGGRRERREEPDLDWGSARSEMGSLPPRERSRRGPPGDRPPRKEEPDLDWGSARSEMGTLPPRERSRRVPSGDRPRRQEPELDWGSARSETTTLPPRERSNRKPRKQEPELDWGSARNEMGTLPPREKSNRRKGPEDWNKSKKEEKIEGPQKSSYDVLAIEGDSDEEPEKEEIKKEPKKSEPVEDLQKATAKLSVEEDGWEVVRK